MDNYAGFWIRTGAYLIDSILLTFVMLVILFVMGGAIGLASDPGGPSDAAAGVGVVIMYLLIFGGQWLYFALMESSEKQATLGKMAVGIIVTDEHGGRLSFGRATGRYFGKILSGLIMYIGYIMVAFTDRKQGLHDMLASTLVVHGRPGDVAADPAVFS